MGYLRRRLFLILLLAHPLWPAEAVRSPPNEYGLKAVFLYHFCHFIDWPDSAFGSRRDPLVIGVVGADPFGALLEQAIAGENYRGHPIQIEHFHGVRDLRRCHLLFVPQANSDQLPQILSSVAGKGVVTVGENNNFLERGGMIALSAEQDRVRLRINTVALRATRVNVSSKLLEVADRHF